MKNASTRDVVRTLVRLTDLPTWLGMGALMAAAFASASLTALWPVLLSEACQKIGFMAEDALRCIVLFALVFIGGEALSRARAMLVETMVARLEYRVRMESTRKMFRLPVSYYEGMLSGGLTARMNYSISGFSQLMKIIANDVLPALFTAGMILHRTLANAPVEMTVIMVGYLLVSVIISFFQIRSQNGIRERILRMRSDLDGALCQSIVNIELIRSMDADLYEQQRLAPAVEGVCKSETSHHIVMGSFDLAKKLTQAMTFCLLLGSCYAMTRAGLLEGAMTLTVLLLFQQLVAPTESVYRCMDELVSSGVKARTLAEIFLSTEDPHYAGTAKPERTGDILSVTGCTIQAPLSQETISTPPDFTVHESEIIALCGPAGCGKTSVLRGMKGYFPYTGSLKLCGNEVDTYSVSMLSDTIFYVPQTALFFQGTVRDNLLFGARSALSDEQLYNALRRAQLLHQLEQLTESPLDYMVLEGGKNLSAGQRQRLALARVFLHRFRLLILDESTANIDLSTMKLALNEVEAYARSQHAAIIYISHEPEVVARCQRSVHLTPMDAGGLKAA